MTVARSAKQILSKINCPHLDLVRVTGKEGGYWYFVYDDVPNNVYETESVYVMRLNDMDLNRWVSTGLSFVLETEKSLEDRPERHENMSMIFKNMEK